MFKNGTHIGGIGHTEYAGSSDGDYENPACRIAINHFDVQRRLGNREEHVYGTATDRDSDDKRDHDEVVAQSFIEWTDCHIHRLRDVAYADADGNCNVHGRRHNTRNWRTGTLSGGKATYGTASLSSASHNVSAIYDGTSNIRGSTLGTLVQEVN